MRKLIIAGAGGFGRVVAAWAKQIPKEEREWEIYGFIDDNIHALDNFNTSAKIIGTISDYYPQEDELLVCAIGDSLIRLDICRMLAGRGVLFTNIIHPTVTIGDNSVIGKGVIICPYALVSSNVRVGDFVIINVGAVVGHDAVVEDGCTIHGHCDINGNAYLEEGVFMGCHAIVIPGVRIGKHARVGAGSVVIRNVEEKTAVFGNPAKKIS